MQMEPLMDFKTKLGRKAKRLIKENIVIWLTTVDASLTPQPRPVWFIWDVDSFLIFSQPNAHKVQHLIERPQVSLNFNTDPTGDEVVVVFLGTAVIEPNAPPADKVSAYIKKYRSEMKALKMSPAEFSRSYSVAIRITPTALRGW
jgi:PPOX class probable F420-dependent enzyme